MKAAIGIYPSSRQNRNSPILVNAFWFYSLGTSVSMRSRSAPVIPPYAEFGDSFIFLTAPGPKSWLYGRIFFQETHVLLYGVVVYCWYSQAFQQLMKSLSLRFFLELQKSLRFSCWPPSRCSPREFHITTSLYSFIPDSLQASPHPWVLNLYTLFPHKSDLRVSKLPQKREEINLALSKSWQILSTPRTHRCLGGAQVTL